MDTVGYLRQQHAIRLNSAKEGTLMKVVLISEVVEDESALLTYLGQVNIMPGARATVLERVSADHSLKVSIVPRGEPQEKAHSVFLSNDLAAKIWVARAEE